MNRGILVGASLVAAALTGCGSAPMTGASTTSPMVTVTPTGWTTTPFNPFVPLVVARPRAWRFVPPPLPTPGPWATLGYFTNQTPHAPCKTTKLAAMTQTTCRGPISTLAPGGVVATLSSGAFAPAHVSTNAVVDGQRVEIKVYPATKDCPAGATGTETMKAYSPVRGSTQMHSRSEIDVAVCYNATGSPSTAGVVDRVVRSIRFHW